MRSCESPFSDPPQVRHKSDRWAPCLRGDQTATGRPPERPDERPFEPLAATAHHGLPVLVRNLAHPLIVWLVGLCLEFLGPAPVWADLQIPPAPALAPERLIEQLGAPAYAQRIKARDTLAEMGMDAIDALQLAQRHPDAEVRKQATFLLRAIPIEWVQADDGAEVRQILRNYRHEDPTARRERILELQRLSWSQRLAPLCRIARYEADEDLSKWAALALLQAVVPTLKEGAPANPSTPTATDAPRLRSELGASSRPATRWLLALAQYLESPAAARELWQSILAEEETQLPTPAIGPRVEIVQALLRWQIAAWRRAELADDAATAMRHLLKYQEDRRAPLVTTCNWLIDLQAWNLIDLVVEQFRETCDKDPYLLYRRAEVLMRTGKLDEAEALVQRAMQVPTDEDDVFLHVELGVNLQSRGLIEWAEREYRTVAKQVDPPTHPPVEALARLGWMYHDLGRDQEAYEAFKQLVDWMDRDRAVVRLLQELSRIPVQVRGQMFYSQALALAKEKKYAEQRVALQTALQHDQSNADIVIAMFRMPEADEAWQRETRQHLQRMKQMYETQIAIAQRDLQSLPGDDGSRYVAMQLNQYAWLVANTDGDYQAALRASQQSLTLVPEEAGYLDTLARCHYALGQLDEAIKHQRRAVELEPHSGQIRRQLESFEAEQRAAQAAGTTR